MQHHKDKSHCKTQRPLICADNRTKGKPELANTNLNATIQESHSHALIPLGKILSRLSMGSLPTYGPEIPSPRQLSCQGKPQGMKSRTSFCFRIMVPR